MSCQGGVEFDEEVTEAGGANSGVLGQRVGQNRLQSSGKRDEVGLVGEVSIENLGSGFSVKGHSSGEQFVDDGCRTVDIDFGSVLAS